MSTTFTLALGDVLGWKVSCTCPDVHFVHDELTAALHHLDVGTRIEGCTVSTSCLEYGLFLTSVEADPAAELDVNDKNAQQILNVLGLSGDRDGFYEAGDFLGRVLLAQALLPVDSGLVAHDSTSRWTEGVNRPGYLDEVLDTLRTIAEHGVRTGREVGWV